MRSNPRSKFRLLAVMAILAAGAMLVMYGSAFAQSTPAAGTTGAAAPPAVPSNVFGLILQNVMDPIFFVIVALSIVGLTLIIQSAIKNRAAVMMPEATVNHIRDLIGQRQFKELIEYTESDPTFISRALNPALKRAPSFSSMKEAMETALGEQTAEQFRKIEYLNIIGNLGPLLGLMGTVLGMITAFLEMFRKSGAASPGDLAHGIAVALCHTFLGLALAVPCLAAFGVFRTIVDRLTVQGALVAEELLLMIKPAEAKPSSSSSRSGGAVPQPGVPMPRKVPVPMAPPPAPANM
jgi:biopolymer transport protein ExbB